MSSSISINRSSYQTSTGRAKIRAFVAAVICAAALPGCAVFPHSSNPTADQKITADVKRTFLHHADLEPPNLIEVQTVNQVVYLNGTVATGLQRRDAESVAEQVQGVEKVVDFISVTR